MAASGCIGGIITSGILYAFAGNTGDTPAMLIGEKPHYARGYIDGYQYITKKKKRKAILTGAVVGTALSTLWLYGISQPVYAW